MQHVKEHEVIKKHQVVSMQVEIHNAFIPGWAACWVERRVQDRWVMKDRTTGEESTHFNTVYRKHYYESVSPSSMRRILYAMQFLVQEIVEWQ